jgi:hypothetical protein
MPKIGFDMAEEHWSLAGAEGEDVNKGVFGEMRG